MKQVKVWGMGSGAKKLILRLKETEYQIVGITDTNTGEETLNYGDDSFYGFKIYSREDWVKIKSDYTVVCAKGYFNEICMELRKIGVIEKIWDVSSFYQQILFKQKNEYLLANNDLYRFFINSSHRPMEKWIHYFEVYDQFLRKFRNKDIVMCEIGVCDGGSLQMWKNYFGDKAHIVGIDIDKRCKAFEEEDISVEIGSQDDTLFLDSIKKKYPKIDILIDDGGHIMNQQIRTLEELYPHISYNGIYICEDTHTSYWKSYDGGYKKYGSFIEYIKEFIDKVNAWHSETELLKPDYYTRSIAGIHIYDSMVVLEKKKMDFPLVIKK